MSFLFDAAHAYSEDRELMESFGLRTNNFEREWTYLGTVVLQESEERTYGEPKEMKTRPATTVKVEVAAYPAQFWRFTIARSPDKVEDPRGVKLWRSVYEPVERFEITTGSGSFSEYWPSVKKVADHCFEVRRLESEEANDPTA